MRNARKLMLIIIMLLCIPITGVNAYTSYRERAEQRALAYMHTNHPETVPYDADISSVERGRYMKWYSVTITYDEGGTSFKWKGGCLKYWDHVWEEDYSFSKAESSHKYKTKIYYDLNYIIGQWIDYPNEYIVTTPDVDARKYKLNLAIINSEGDTTMNLTFYMRRDYTLVAYLGSRRFTEGVNTVIASTKGWSETFQVVR